MSDQTVETEPVRPPTPNSTLTDEAREEIWRKWSENLERLKAENPVVKAHCDLRRKWMKADDKTEKAKACYLARKSFSDDLWQKLKRAEQELPTELKNQISAPI